MRVREWGSYFLVAAALVAGCSTNGGMLQTERMLPAEPASNASIPVVDAAPIDPGFPDSGVGVGTDDDDDDDDEADAGNTEVAPAHTAIFHVGDSLSAYTQSDLIAAYAAEGLTATIDAYGARAIRQKLPADPRTGLDAVELARAGGFTGCWVIALGTNDTANVAAGAGYTRTAVIDQMMETIDASATAPVLWINTFTEMSTGYYANANMVLWNDSLVEAEGRWPNLTVLNWAAIAASGAAPFSDGIHHTAAGYRVRNQAIAAAVADLVLGP